MEEVEIDAPSRTSRKRFLKQLGVTLAVGVGAAVTPGVVFAQNRQGQRPEVVYNCCPDTHGHCSNGDCGQGKVHYYCDCSREGQNSYCTLDCTPTNSTCYNGPC